MKRLFNRCGRWRKQISLLANDSLPVSAKADVENHLALCPGCQAYFEEMKTLSALLTGCKAKIAQVEPSPLAQTRWRNAILPVETSSTPWSFLTDLWRELLWPCRRAVTGMAVLWLAMWVINSGVLGLHVGTGRVHNPLSPATWQNFVDQRQLLAELTRTTPKQPAEPPRRSVLRPRGERPSGMKIC